MAVDLPARLATCVDGSPHPGGRKLEDVTAVGLRDIGEAKPGRELRLPERLRHPHVPDPGDEALVDQTLAERARRICPAETREHRVEVGRRCEDVRTEPGERAGVQFENRAAPEDTFELGAAEDEPGPAAR